MCTYTVNYLCITTTTTTITTTTTMANDYHLEFHHASDLYILHRKNKLGRTDGQLFLLFQLHMYQELEVKIHKYVKQYLTK